MKISLKKVHCMFEILKIEVGNVAKGWVYKEMSMAQTSLRLWKFVLNMDSSSH